MKDDEAVAKILGACAWELTTDYLGKGKDLPVSRMRAEVLGLRLFLFGLHFARHTLAKISPEEFDRQIAFLAQHVGLNDPEGSMKKTAPMIERAIAGIVGSERPTCIECGIAMTPENAHEKPEFFICDACYHKPVAEVPGAEGQETQE